MPNPSLKLTRYGRRRLAAPGHWHEAASEPDFDLFIGGEYGNTFHQASETAVNMAALNQINRNDKAAALKTFLNDVQNAAHLFNDFLDGVMVVIRERCFRTSLSGLGEEEDVRPTLGIGDIKIPFFYVPPNARSGT